MNKKLGETPSKPLSDTLVQEIMEDPFPTIPAKTPVIQVVGLLQIFEAVLTVDKDKITGIVTNTDLVKVFADSSNIVSYVARQK